MTPLKLISKLPLAVEQLDTTQCNCRIPGNLFISDLVYSTRGMWRSSGSRIRAVAAPTDHEDLLPWGYT